MTYEELENAYVNALNSSSETILRLLQSQLLNGEDAVSIILGSLLDFSEQDGLITSDMQTLPICYQRNRSHSWIEVQCEDMPEPTIIDITGFYNPIYHKQFPLLPGMSDDDPVVNLISRSVMASIFIPETFVSYMTAHGIFQYSSDNQALYTKEDCA